MSSTLVSISFDEYGNITANDAVSRPIRSCKTYEEHNPLHSLAMSVHPDQCAMMNEAVKRHGISGVRYDPSKTRNCVITSREGRRKWMKVFGQMTDHGAIHDNDGGYGDG